MRSPGSNRTNSFSTLAGKVIPRVLVVDDEPDLRELLELTLVRMGMDVDSASNVADARKWLERHRYALCLTDMRLPDASGIELVETIARDYPATVVAVITAYGSADNAVAALKAGAFDYLSKPVALQQLRDLVQAAVRASRDTMDRPGPRGAADNATKSGLVPVERLLGESAAMREVRAMIVKVARSQAPVAISGESGSGKELAARAIHDCSGRRDEPFIAVNCGAIPEQLMEAEFFGYRKGAFTGADTDRNGFFHAARGGTLFLDEVADLPLNMQVKLLRVIQERLVRRIGDVNEEPVDVRIISATHQDLLTRVNDGRFRQDLYYRLNVIGIYMPALRERRSDIPILARHLLRQIAPTLTLTDAAIERLMEHAFVGNVRELGNVLERSAAFADADSIHAQDIHFASVPSAESGASQSSGLTGADGTSVVSHSLSGGLAGGVSTGLPVSGPLGLRGSLIEHLDLAEREIIERALFLTRYNRTAAAGLLGITFRQLRYRMQRLNIQ